VILTKFKQNMQIESILEEDLGKIIKKMDKNGDGQIQYSEFID